MRRIRKALSAVLALVMLLSLVVPVSAEGEAATFPGAGSLESQTATFTVKADPAKPQRDASGVRLVTFRIYVSGTVPIQAFSFNLAPSAGLELADTSKANADDPGFCYSYPQSAAAWAEGEGKYKTFGYSNGAANPMYFAAAGMDAGQGISAETEVLTIVGRVTAGETYSLGLTNVIAGDGYTVDSMANQFTRAVTPASGKTGPWAPNVSASPTTDVTTGQVDTFTVKLSHGAMTVGSFTGGLRFDTSQLAVTKIEKLNGYNSLASGVVSELSTVAEANQTGRIGAVFVCTEEQTFAAGDILAVTFRSRGDCENVAVTSYEDSDGANGYIGDGASVTVSTKTPPGVTVSGTVKSYGDASETVTVTLLQDGTEVGKWSGTGNSAAYSFDAVAAGEYTLKVEKKGHAPWTETITVGAEDITGKNLTVYLYGDVNGDGEVKNSDKVYLARHLAGWEGYEILPTGSAVADVNHDGVLKNSDKVYLARHLAGWEGYENLG